MITMLLLLSPDALAWRHTGLAWEKFPVDWSMDDGAEDSLPEGYDEEVVIKSFQNWELQAACAGVSDAYGGRSDLGTPDHYDGSLGIYWDDPGDEAGPGVLGVTYPWGPFDKFQTNSGTVVWATEDADIVFNDSVDFGSTEDIDNGICVGETSIEAVATHEVGHLWGLGHSCEQDEACEDELLLNATMYWSSGPCDTHQTAIGQDDIDSITGLYSAAGGFAATTTTKGAVPLTVDFAISADVDVVGAEWNFGDGGSSSEYPDASHTFNEPGQYSIAVEMSLDNDVCGVTTYTAREAAYVTACGQPGPEAGSEGFFEASPVEGLLWQTINHTDVSVYGCVDQISWEVYKGGSVSGEPIQTLSAWAPEIEFPEAGTYTIQMNVGGVGGNAGAVLTVEAVAGVGCASAPGTAGALVAALGGAIVALRRRR